MTRRCFLTIPAVLAAHRPEDGFVPLFDGRTLEGWRIREGPETAFYVEDGCIVIHRGANFPTWLSTTQPFENFDFRCEILMRGWSNSGIYIHAPEHGRPTWTGMKINLFHKVDRPPLPESMGAIFPLVAPKVVNVRDNAWNSLRILSDWPLLRVWSNDELVQDLNLEHHPDLRYRFRSGYLGIESLSYPLRFRNLRIRPLPAKEQWEVLYGKPEDLAEKWEVAEGKASWEALGRVLRADGLGYLKTRARYRNFEFRCYIRGSQWHNGGIIFGGDSVRPSEHYEIQLHDVEGAVYPTGSLYGFRRSRYPQIAAEQWFPFQLIVRGADCVVRINGENVVEYSGLERMQEAPIMLQAHQAGRWIEYKDIRIKRLEGTA